MLFLSLCVEIRFALTPLLSIVKELPQLHWLTLRSELGAQKYFGQLCALSVCT